MEDQIQLTGGSGKCSSHPDELLRRPDVILVAESDIATAAGESRCEKIAGVAKTLGVHSEVDWKWRCARKFGHDRRGSIRGAVIGNDQFQWQCTLAGQGVQLGLQVTLAIEAGKGN
nr:hypothetical protein [Synechococcus sp. CS-1331]